MAGHIFKCHSNMNFPMSNKSLSFCECENLEEVRKERNGGRVQAAEDMIRSNLIRTESSYILYFKLF